MSRGHQLARQWQVLRVLENHRYGISVEDLSTRLEWCRRTLERDLKALLDMGFPIQSETIEFGKKRWKLTKQFVESDHLILTPTEIISLYLANKMINPLAGTYLENGWKQFFTKLQSILPTTVLSYFSELDETLYVKSTQPSASVPAAYLETLRKAVKEHTIVNITYRRENKTSSVILHPYGLIVYDNSFYVIGYNQKLDEVRTYKLQRISYLEPTRKKFIMPVDFSLDKCFRGCFGIIENSHKPAKTVRCQMTGWAGRIVREQKWHRTQVIEKDDGQTLIVSFLLDSTVEFTRWVLGFGALAQVLEPEETRKEVITKLNETLSRYK